LEKEMDKEMRKKEAGRSRMRREGEEEGGTKVRSWGREGVGEGDGEEGGWRKLDKR
jgi:hypothetical protein